MRKDCPKCGRRLYKIGKAGRYVYYNRPLPGGGQSVGQEWQGGNYLHCRGCNYRERL